MPIKTSSLKNNKRTITVDYFGDTFDVTYRPSELTIAVEDDLRNSTDNTVLLDTLCRLVTSWEVLDDDGIMLPIEPGTIKDIDSALLSHIIFACREDMLPKLKNGRR